MTKLFTERLNLFVSKAMIEEVKAVASQHFPLVQGAVSALVRTAIQEYLERHKK